MTDTHVRSMPVWYMAHPVGLYVGPPPDKLLWSTPDNLERAKQWLVYLHRAWPEVVVIAPWLHDIGVLPLLDEVPEHREIGLRRMEAIAELCDAVVLVGGRVSAGMLREATAARRARKDVFDWTHLGEWPPGHPLHKAVLL